MHSSTQFPESRGCGLAKPHDGEYEFYDAPEGFHQLTGEALTIVTQDVVTQWRRDPVWKKKKRTDDERRERDQAIKDAEAKRPVMNSPTPAARGEGGSRPEKKGR